MQDLIITNAAEIKFIASEIKLFGTPKQYIRVRLQQFSKEENLKLEKKIVSCYAAYSDKRSRTIGISTLFFLLFLLFVRVIPSHWLGLNLFFLYLVLTSVFIFSDRYITQWFARRALIRLSDQLHAPPLFYYM